MLADVAACAERAHGINIKLAKSGGIREAVRMVHAARALGLGVMLGCMVESGLGIAPGRAHREPHGPRRPRRQPAPRARPVARRRVRRRRAASLRRARDGCCARVGCSSSPRASRTTRTTGRPPAASCATGREDVVAVLDSEIERDRARGIPARAHRRGGAAATSRPSRSSGSRRRAAAFRPRGASSSKDCIRAGLDVENGLHEFISDRSGAGGARARARRSSCATSAWRRPG